MKQIGYKLEMDLGTGTLEIIPLSSLGETITFSESITGFGGSEISFTLRDLDSPIKSALLRGMRAARLTLYWGTPGATLNDVVFDGYLREARWQHDTRSADVTCQDASIKFANQRVFYTLAAFAAKTREDIVGEIATAMGIPTGTISAPGTNYKAINEGGDNTVLQFFADLVAPSGSRVWWRDGALQIGPAGLGTPVAVLKLADIRGPINVTPPATTTPNSIEFTSTLFPYLGDQGYTTTVVTDDTSGSYTPAGSVRQQDHTTGTITAHVVSPGAETLITRVITTTRKWGDTELDDTVETWGWYAARACPSQLLPTGESTLNVDIIGTPPHGPGPTSIGGTGYSLSWNPSFDVYEFGASGSGDWRIQDAETFQIISRAVTAHHFSLAGIRESTSVIASAFAAQELPIGSPAFNDGYGAWQVEDTATETVLDYPYLHGDGSPWIFYGTGSPAGWGFGILAGGTFQFTILALADGSCWYEGKETLREVERLTTVYDVAPDGHLKSASSRVESLMIYVWRLSGAAFDPPVYAAVLPPAQTYILGPAATPRWCDQLGGTLLKAYTWVVEYALDELSYDLAHWETTTLTAVTRALANQPDTMTQFTPPSAGTVSVETPLPYPVTRTIITSDPQPGKVITTEDVLIALNGTIAGYGSSDFAETNAEMTVCGNAVLRDTCSSVVDFSRDPDGTIRAGDTITVDAAPLSDDAEDLLVLSSTITLNFKANEFSQALTCLWIPPELA